MCPDSNRTQCIVEDLNCSELCVYRRRPQAMALLFMATGFIEKCKG